MSESKAEATAVVVNDDPTQLDILAALLQKAGIDPTAFERAEAALAAMDPANPPALIVTALHMPGIDGWRFCRLLRSPEYAAFNGVPILVFSTAFAWDHPERIAADIGADGFLPSSVDGKEFTAQARALLGGKQSRPLPRALIVEDSKSLAGILAKAFTAHGYRADTAFSVREAEAAFAKAAYDVAVLDYRLPDGTGDALLDAVRTGRPACAEHADRPDCVCVMMTTDPTPELALDWMKRGADAHLRKPFEPGYLIELCAKARRERALLRTEDLLEARKQAEQAIRASEEKYRTLVDGSLQGVVIAQDEPVRLSFANAAMENLSGYSVDELLSMGASDLAGLIHPDDRERFFGNFKRRLAGESVPPVAEYRLLRKDGKVAWALCHSSAIDYLGEAATLTTFVDITERVEAERALAEQEALLAAIYRNAPLVLMVVDGERRVRQVNGFATQFAGRPAEEMLGLRGGEALRCLHALDDPQGCGFGEYCGQCVIRNTVLHTLETGETHLQVEAPYYFQSAGGEVREMTLLCSATPLNMGEESLALVTLLDITERKEAEEALWESEERHRNLFETMILGLVYQDAEGRIISANPAAERILGLTTDQMMGRTSHDPEWHAIREDGCDFPGDEHPSMVALRTGKEVTGEVMGVFDPGDEKCRWINISAVPMFREGEEAPYRVYTTFEDITESKRAEQEKEKLQAQLAQAQKMESVGRLAGGVAHDFNNMLGVILGHAAMILKRMDPDQPFHANLLEIQKAGMRSADLTRQLLAFARKQTVAPEVIDLNNTISGMLLMLQRLIGENIDTAWVPGKKVWPVKIDPGQIDQILANLCVNARDAIAGVGKVTIETDNTVFDRAYCADHAGFMPGEYVMLAVSDNGCGMDAETLSHLFEPFFTTKETGKGTGLGLATVYGVVKQNNGFINVYSEPGHGTTLRIYLPRHLAKADRPAEQAPDKPAKRGHETILLVEDEPAILRMTAMMLEREGYTVVSAGTPGEAIRLANEHAGTIHLLMSDVVMPEMNGRDLAKNILSLYPGAKRLFMSGYTADVIAHHGILDEGVNFIQKPFSIEGLAVKVRAVLDRE